VRSINNGDEGERVMATLDKWTVGILIFDGVEVLDFAGPFEVFSRTRLVPGVESRRSEESAPFQVFTVAKSHAPVSTTGGLRVIPHYAVVDAPGIDLLVVPGGFGTRALLDDAETLEWIRRAAEAARKVTSVCTGSLLLAKAGLLAGRRATTHWGALDLLASLDPGTTVERELRVVDDGVISSAGVASGIDMAFYVVEQLFGRDVADETARYIEYRRAAMPAHGSTQAFR
jgi:transcriptional regulator GlxA family with amidase domain